MTRPAETPPLRVGQIWMCREQRKRCRILSIHPGEDGEYADAHVFSALTGEVTNGWAYSEACMNKSVYLVFSDAENPDDLVQLLYDPLDA